MLSSNAAPITKAQLLPSSSNVHTVPAILAAIVVILVILDVDMIPASCAPSVTIFFLSHVFFLIFIVHHPYFHFASEYEETDHYLLTFGSSSPPLFLPL